MSDHNHCKAVTCYNRIQFMATCSRCGGSTTPCRGAKDGCGRGVTVLVPKFHTPTSVEEADKLLEDLR